MYTGRDALFSVEQAISRVRTDEGQLDQTLRSAMEEAARLRREEAQAFRALAQFKLNTLMREKVVADLDSAEQRALAMIEKYRLALEDIAQKRNAAQKRLDAAEAEKHRRDQDLAHALERLDQFRQRIADRIKSTPEWQRAASVVEAAKKIAANADQKASLSEADLATKRIPYEQDPLFMYLWNKKFGQAEDKSFNIVRYFDQMIAGLTGYLGARANYGMLNEIPLRLREHANEKQKDVEPNEDQVKVIERKALVAEGVEPIEAELEKENASVKAAGATVAKITAELAEIEAERQRAIGAGDDAMYSRAVDLLSQTLAQEDLGRLYQEALRTPAKQDEELVEAIGKTRESLKRADAEVAQVRTQIREMARRRTELEGARDRARDVGFDNPMGNYGNGQDAIGQVIGGILRGALGGRDLDRVLRDNYRHPMPRSDPDFGGSGRTAPFPYPWGRASTWGRSGGSGWTTGGSF